MASFARRARSAISGFFSSTGDPGATTGIVKLYQKSGQLYCQTPTAVSQLTPLKAATAFPEWVAVDEMTLAGTTGTTVSFKSGGNGSQNYAVNGDVDLWYKLTWDLTGNASGCGVRVQFNGGGDTNQTEQRMNAANTTIAAAQSSNNANLANSSGASCRNSGEWICRRMNTGVTRTGTCFRNSQVPASTADQLEIDGWLFNDSASNITAIDLVVSLGSATGQIVLWKRAPFSWE